MDFTKYKNRFVGHRHVALGPQRDGGICKSTSGLLPVSTHLLPGEMEKTAGRQG